MLCDAVFLCEFAHIQITEVMDCGKRSICCLAFLALSVCLMVDSLPRVHADATHYGIYVTYTLAILVGFMS